MTDTQHCSPGDLLEYRCPRFGIIWQWRVLSVCMGGLYHESLIEVQPVSRHPGYGHSAEPMKTVWVPEPMTRLLKRVRPGAQAEGADTARLAAELRDWAHDLDNSGEGPSRKASLLYAAADRLEHEPGRTKGGRDAAAPVKLVCPVCGLGNHAWLSCNYIGCSDGRGLVPAQKKGGS